jgi:tetratricopeptide (TPR) repeat protein
MARPGLLAVAVLLSAVWASSNVEAQSKKGMEALGAGDYEQAIAIFKAEAQRGSDKDRFINNYFLGATYQQNKQLPEAIAAFEEALKYKDRAARDLVVSLFLYSCYGELGQAYLDNGQYEQAGSNLSSAATICLNMSRIKSSLYNPDPAKWERNAGRYYGLLGRAHVLDTSYQGAVDAYKKAMELDPTNGLHYSGLALAYVGLKQYDDALAAAKRGVELAANSQASYGALGDVYASRKEYDQAIDAYRKVVEIAPLQLADQVNERKTAGDMSQRVYDQLREAVNAASAGLYLKSSQMFIAKADNAGALEAINKAAELTPKDPDIYYRLGAIQARAGKFDEGVASLDKVISLVTFVGTGVQIRIEDGQAVLQRQVEGEPGLMEGPAKEAGLKAGDKLLKIDGQPTKGWDANKVSQSLRGDENTRVVLTVQRQGEAKPFDKPITRRLIVPKAAAPYYGLRGLCVREKGNREGAVKDAELAYSLDPENVDAREALAALDLDGGKYDEALKLLSPLKDNPFARILEATSYARQNDLNRAIAVYTAIPEEEVSATALRQSAKNTLDQALRGYAQARLDKARAAESAGRFVEALAEYSDAVKIEDEATALSTRQRVATLLKDNPYLAELPEEARKYALRGDVLIKDGRFDEALKEYRTAIGIAPFNPKLHFNTALICGQLKNYRLAIKYMTTYLQLSPDALDARAAKDEIYKWEFSLERAGKR